MAWSSASRAGVSAGSGWKPAPVSSRPVLRASPARSAAQPERNRAAASPTASARASQFLPILIVDSNRGGLMDRTCASRLVVTPAAFHPAAFAIHVSRTHPVGQGVVGPVLAPPARRRIEISVHAEELFPAAPIGGIGVEDVAGVVLDEDAVAREVLE